MKYPRDEDSACGKREDLFKRSMGATNKSNRILSFSHSEADYNDRRRRKRLNVSGASYEDNTSDGKSSDEETLQELKSRIKIKKVPVDFSPSTLQNQDGLQYPDSDDVTIGSMLRDDTIMICKAEETNMLALKRCLEQFGQATGLKINFTKSTLVTMHTDEVVKHNLANILQCKLDRFPLLCLGLPLSQIRLRLCDLHPTIAKADRYLAGWQAKLLSYAERITLVNAVLDSLPIYAMVAIPLPKGTIEAFDKKEELSFGQEKIRVTERAV